jgi:hypothetical protein
MRVGVAACAQWDRRGPTVFDHTNPPRQDRRPWGALRFPQGLVGHRPAVNSETGSRSLREVICGAALWGGASYQ